MLRSLRQRRVGWGPGRAVIHGDRTTSEVELVDIDTPAGEIRRLYERNLEPVRLYPFGKSGQSRVRAGWRTAKDREFTTGDSRRYRLNTIGCSYVQGGWLGKLWPFAKMMFVRTGDGLQRLMLSPFSVISQPRRCLQLPVHTPATAARSHERCSVSAHASLHAWSFPQRRGAPSMYAHQWSSAPA